MNALKKRHDHFADLGCCISDHGGDVMYADYTTNDVNTIFEKMLQGQLLHQSEVAQFKSAVLYQLALLDHGKGWVQQ